MGEKCKHEISSLERIKELEYSCEDTIKILIKDVCECGKELGKEIHVFRFSHIEEIKE